MLRVLPFLLLTACACPPNPCDSALRVTMGVDRWVEGTYALSVTAGDDTFACSVISPADDTPPTNLDVDCDGRVERASFLDDTQGAVLGDQVALRAVIPRGDALPGSVKVAVTHTPSEGASQVLLAGTQQVTWRLSRPLAGRCAWTCREGLVTAEVVSP